MRWSSALSAALAGVLLVACSPAAEPAGPPIPDESLTQPPQVPRPVVLTPEAEETRDELLSHARAGSLTRLSRVANANDGFVSNLGGAPHRQYWDLMRRIGADPNRRLRELFDLQPGMREIDGDGVDRPRKGVWMRDGCGDFMCCGGPCARPKPRKGGECKTVMPEHGGTLLEPGFYRMDY